MFRRCKIAALALTTLGVGATAVALDTARLSNATDLAEPDMVKPESLPQGFVLVVRDETGTANPNTPMYLASSINGWNPADPEFILSPRSDTRWQIIIDQGLDGVGMQFKFTLGGWDREELDGTGTSIANRSLPMVDRSRLGPGERPVIEFSIPEWREPVELAEEVRKAGLYRELNVTGDVRRMTVRGGAGGSEAMSRDLLVWLPPGYDEAENAARSYPVLYMMDGQNLFEPMPNGMGEWRADETAQELVESGRIEPLIIVGVPHAGANRISEYLPIGSIAGADADGPAFVDWLRREVMPRVESGFRVATGPENTAIGGASLGGSISLYASTRHPEVFGQAIVESLPMLQDDGDAMRNYLDSVSEWPQRVFVGMGGKEISIDPADGVRNAKYRAWALELDQRMKEAGLGSDRRRLRLDADAHHNEAAWSARFPEALIFLFASRD